MHNKNVVLMENHNEALSWWRKTCQNKRILVHVDTHFDFAWIADRDPLDMLNVNSFSDFKAAAKESLFWNLSGKRENELIHIGNYIYPAINENIVREFYWVVPDSLFSNKRKIMCLKKDIDGIIRFNSKEDGRLNWQGCSLISYLHGAKLVICRLKDLPEFEENVLVDIDVYYFSDKEKPWLYAEDFIQRLKEHGLKSDLITIAYSVEGGFTPIGYKFIGDHLACLLNGHTQQDKQFEKAVSLIVKALDSKRTELYKDAILYLKEADSYHPGYAATYYHLSDIYYEMGLRKEAYDYYHKAVSNDVSYRTLYNNRGPLFEDRLMLKEADAEYRKMLELDPYNPCFFTRLGNIYRKRKRWDDAIFNYNEALKLDPDSDEALRNIGYIQALRNDLDEGLKNLKKSLSIKPHNPLTHSYLGFIYMKKRDYNSAMRETRRAINSGLFTNPGLRWRLVFIYLKKMLYDRMFDELKAALIVSCFEIFQRIRVWLRF